MLRAALTTLLTTATLLVMTSAADARVVAVATGTTELVLTDVPAGNVVARMRLGAPTRDVVATPDGSRALVATGRSVTVVDLATRATATTPPLRATISSLALSADGTRLLAARRGAIDVFDTATMTLAGSVNLRGAQPGAVAISADGLRAAVVLGARVGLVDLAELRLMRRTGRTTFKPIGRRRGAPRPGGVAFARSGSLVWVSTTDGALRALNRVSGRRGGADRPQGRRRRVGRDLSRRHARGGRRQPRQPRRRDRRPRQTGGC